MDQLGVTQENSFCTRDDKQNLVEKWMQGKKNYLFVNTSQDLMNADLSQVTVCS